MPSLIEDIEEFMEMPYEQVISSINGSIKDYRIDLWTKTFPWGVKKDNIFDYYRSDQYAATLFKEAVDVFESQAQSHDKEHAMPQILANIVDKYEVVELPNGIITDPRILYYGCGNAMMLFELIGMNKWKITLADVDSAYFEFLKFLSGKYAQLNGLKFLEINKDNEFPIQGDRKYDIIIVDGVLEHAFDPIKTLQYLCSHLEDMGNIYITSNFVEDHPEQDPSNTSLLLPQHREKWDKIIEDCGLKKVVEDEKTKSVIWQKVAPMIIKVDTPIKENRIFPTEISFLSTLPGEQCGISTYTNYLRQEISKKYPTNIFREICDVPDNSAIVAQIEFGIFPPDNDQYKHMLLSKKYTDNWKFAMWHTVIREPTPAILRYIQDIDKEYDIHMVHTSMQKVWLSRFVTKPVEIIPHGTLLWEPAGKEDAKARLVKEYGHLLSKDDRIMFAFGFASENKGLEQLIEAAKLVKSPNFKLVISGAPHGAAKGFTQKIIDNLKKRADTSNVIILGKHLTDEDINLWASAADILIFNYTTPPYVASASGAMKRVLASGRPILCVDDNRLEDLVNGQHCIKYTLGNTPELVISIETLLSDSEMAEKLGKNCRLLAEQTSWEKTADKYIDIISKLTGTFGQEYYDQEYFIGNKGGKKFVDPTGETKKWSYYNETGEWLAAELIMKAIKMVLNPDNMLSVGEGRGVFVAYARDAGIDAIGQDFSKWAIENPYPRAKGLVTMGDVRDIQFPDYAFSLVFCSDIMEHVYLEDLPKAISEIQRVSNKWIFYNIGASMADDKKEDMVLQKNKLPPKDRQVTAVAGHVTVKPESWWREKLTNEHWKLRDDLVAKFRELVPKEALENWKCVLICSREDKKLGVL